MTIEEATRLHELVQWLHEDGYTPMVVKQEADGLTRKVQQLVTRYNELKAACLALDGVLDRRVIVGEVKRSCAYDDWKDLL